MPRIAGACQPQTANSSNTEANTGSATGMTATGRQRSGRPIAISGAAMAMTPMCATMPAANDPRHAPSSGPSQTKRRTPMPVASARRFIAGIP